MTEDDIIDKLNRRVMRFGGIPREYMTYNLVNRILTELDITACVWHIMGCDVVIDYNMALLICDNYYKNMVIRWADDNPLGSLMNSDNFMTLTRFLTPNERRKLEITVRCLYG